MPRFPWCRCRREDGRHSAAVRRAGLGAQTTSARQAGAAGHGGRSTAWSFPNTLGGPLDRTICGNGVSFRCLLGLACPHPLPELRHRCATLLLSEAFTKIVSDLLSQIGITLDRYSHVTATMQAIAVQAVGRLLGGQDDSQATDGGQGQGP